MLCSFSEPACHRIIDWTFPLLLEQLAQDIEVSEVEFTVVHVYVFGVLSSECLRLTWYEASLLGLLKMGKLH